jgi:23S rRNA (uracil1939-C5)-methyltransferase
MSKHAQSQPIEGRVRDLAHGGDAVVETERGIVMARGALPDERVRVQVERKQGGVLRGTIVEITERSQHRQVAVCPVAERCGGCPLMTLAVPAQLQWKRERLRRLLHKIGAQIEPEMFASPKLLGYRARARLAWQTRGAVATIGYHAAGRSEPLDIEHCAVLQPALAHGLHSLRERLRSVLVGRGEITLGPGAGGLCTIELASEVAQPDAVHVALESLVADGDVAGVVLRTASDAALKSFGDARQFTVGPDGLALWSPPGAFVQANPEVNARLAAYVTTLAEARDARVVELYAGHGNLSVLLSVGALSLHAIEAVPGAAEACRGNLAARGLVHARVTCDDAAHGLQASGRDPVDVVVLDPPRAGAREALPHILERKPNRIVYVACDPATLRRDLAQLCAAGYRVDAAAVFDMFPHTAHVESVVRLQK